MRDGSNLWRYYSKGRENNLYFTTAISVWVGCTLSASCLISPLHRNEGFSSHEYETKWCAEGLPWLYCFPVPTKAFNLTFITSYCARHSLDLSFTLKTLNSSVFRVRQRPRPQNIFLLPNHRPPLTRHPSCSFAWLPQTPDPFRFSEVSNAPHYCLYLVNCINCRDCSKRRLQWQTSTPFHRRRHHVASDFENTLTTKE